MTDIFVRADDDKTCCVLEITPRPADDSEQIESVNGENQGANKENPGYYLEQGKGINKPIINIDKEKYKERFKREESVESVGLTAAKEWPREPEKKCGYAKENRELCHGIHLKSLVIGLIAVPAGPGAILRPGASTLPR